MTPDLSEKTRNWSRQIGADDYVYMLEFVSFIAKHLYEQYQPAANSSYPEFKYRLEKWINSAYQDSDKKELLRLASKLVFFGQREFEAMYRTVVDRVVSRWLIDICDLALDDPDLDSKLNKALRETWFTSLTDSMQLSGFYHVNNIQGIDWKPNWQGSINEGTNISRFVQYMNNNRLTRVVILEDFVGSGTQMNDACELFGQLPESVEVLLSPLLVCPKGVQVGECIASAFPNITFDPVVKIPKSAFVFENHQLDEPGFHRSIREIASRVHFLVCGSGWGQDHGPFGYGGMGGLVVMYTNCPDNTLPLIHHSSDGTWDALFPRSSRI